MLMISKIGLDFTITCLSGISMISEKLYSNITNIISNKNENEKMVNFINESDLLSIVAIIQNFISEISIDDNTSQTIKTCIEEIFDILKKIEREFDDIQNKLDYNSSLCVLKSIRSCKFDNAISRLTILKHILDNRTNLLLKIIPIKNNLQKCENNKYNINILKNAIEK